MNFGILVQMELILTCQSSYDNNFLANNQAFHKMVLYRLQFSVTQFPIMYRYSHVSEGRVLTSQPKNFFYYFK
jgi:hypothetical protein